MKTTLTTTLILFSLVGFGQSKPRRIDTAKMHHSTMKQSYIPDCDTSVIFGNYPCKIPVKNNGKIIGYTMHNSPLLTTSTISFLSLTGDNSSMQYFNPSFNNFKTIKYQFQHNGNLLFQIGMPNEKTGIDTLFIKRKNLKWLNDSTAVYIPKR